MEINTNNNRSHFIEGMTITVPAYFTTRDVRDTYADLLDADPDATFYNFRVGAFEIEWLRPDWVVLRDVEDC